MNGHKVTLATIRQVHAGVARALQGAALDLQAMQAQIAALQQLVPRAGPQPDANGWIARPTLR